MTVPRQGGGGRPAAEAHFVRRAAIQGALMNEHQVEAKGRRNTPIAINSLGIALGVYGLLQFPEYRWICWFVVVVGSVNLILWLRRRRREREDM